MRCPLLSQPSGASLQLSLPVHLWGATGTARPGYQIGTVLSCASYPDCACYELVTGLDGLDLDLRRRVTRKTTAAVPLTAELAFLAWPRSANLCRDWFLYFFLF